MNVFTDENFICSNVRASAAIGMMFLPPTLIPRSSATWRTSVGDAGGGGEPSVRPAGTREQVLVVAVLRPVAPLRELGVGGRGVALSSRDIDLAGRQRLLDEDLDG